MKKLFVLTLSVFLTIPLFSQTNLMGVQPWAYWLQDIDIQTIVDDDSFDLIVLDYSADGSDEQKWTSQEINSIKSSGKYAISYISIGEVEYYRYYWQSEWESSPPSWLGPENPDWEGNFKVRYWMPEWQEIVFDYLDIIIAQGFDGIYMDIIDGYYYWLEENPEQPFADSLMCQFVINIRDHCNAVRGDNDFIILPQNGEDVWDNENVSQELKTAYFNAINGIGVEDVFFQGDLDEDNDYDPDTYRIDILKEYMSQGKQVFAVDYLTDPAKITQFTNAATQLGFVPYVCTRSLEYLCEGILVGSEESYLPIHKDGDTTSFDLVHEVPDHCWIENSFIVGKATINDTVYHEVSYEVIGNIVGYIRQDSINSKAWYRSIEDENEYLIMDLQMELGDSIYVKGGGWYEAKYAKVIGVDTFWNRKRVLLDYQYGGGFISENLSFIEGIGPNAFFTFQCDDVWSPIDLSGGFLTCKKYKNGIQTFQYDTLRDLCFNDTSIEDFINAKSIQIYPNPSSDYIEISLNNGAFSFAIGMTISIYNSYGQEVLNPTLTLPKEGGTSIDISELPSGVYTIVMSSCIGLKPIFMTRKFVVVR